MSAVFKLQLLDYKAGTLNTIPWSSLVEGAGGLYQPNSQTNLVLESHEMSVLDILQFCKHNSLPLGPIRAFNSF